MDAKLHVPSDLTIGYVIRASACSNLYFSWNSYISSTPNVLPSYSIHQFSNSVNLLDMFDARVMKIHYFHTPRCSQMRLAAGLHPDLLGELKCSPRLPSRNGEGDGKRGERREGVGSRNKL